MFEQNDRNRWNQNRMEYEPDEQERAGHSGRYSQGMLHAAMVFSVLSLLTCMMIYLAVPFGAMAILFVLLSRGRKKHPGQARTAVIMAVISMCASTALSGYALYRYYHDPVIRMQVDHLIDYYRGLYLEDDLLDLVNGGAEALTEDSTEAQQPSGMDHDSLMDYYLKPHGNDTPKQPEEEIPEAPDMTSPDMTVPEGSFT